MVRLMLASFALLVALSGNASAQSNGEGAVTYKESTSYRVQYVNNSTYCVVATSNADAAQIQLQNCTSASGALRQWYFTTYSGDTVYVRFATVPDRRWYTTNDNTTGQGLATSTVGLATDRTRWVLGVYWDNTNAHIRISRATSG